jgi:hypothetical protein
MSDKTVTTRRVADAIAHHDVITNLLSWRRRQAHDR